MCVCTLTEQGANQKRRASRRDKKRFKEKVQIIPGIKVIVVHAR